MTEEVICTQAGIRPTAHRLAVLRMLSLAELPQSVDDILVKLRSKNRIDKVTVYRILELFCAHHIVARLELGEGKFRYERTDRKHHHHIVCTNCGKMQDIEDCIGEDITSKTEKATGYRISSHALEFFGLCSKCQKNTLVQG